MSQPCPSRPDDSPALIGSIGSERRAVRRKLKLLAAALVVPLAACAAEVPEQEIGDRLAASLLTELPLLDDVVVDGHVESIGRELSEVSHRPDQRYRFYVVDSPAVNAFSLPGGHVFVSRALIQRTASSSELAGVLAHEIAHIAAGHGVRRLQREMRSNAVVSAVNQLIFGEAPGITENPAARLFERIGDGIYSRADEREADRLAIQYLVDAGFDPRAFIDFLRTVEEEEARMPASPEWLSTHPRTDRRIQVARSKLAVLEIDERNGPPHTRTAATRDVHYAVLARLAAAPPPPRISPLR